MKTQFKVGLVAICMILLLFSGQSQAQNSNRGRYIVTIQRPISNAVRAMGGQVIYEYSIIPAIAIEIPNTALQGLARNPNVIRIEPDAVAWALPSTPAGSAKRPTTSRKPTPTPTPQPEQYIPWGVDRIDAEFSGQTGDGVNVAVIDTGIDYNHQDLAGNYKGGINIVRPRKAPMDDNGHGTHVAGIIAAIDNEIGVVGVAPQANLYAVKVLNAAGLGSYADIIAGIDWCYKTEGIEIDVINMSLGGTLYSEAMKDACDNAKTVGIVVVVAAGNEATKGNPVVYPAAYDSVIAVAATDKNDQRAYFSSYGSYVDIAAPGVNIDSTLPGDKYSGETWSGTSMASPHVAGTVALIIQSYNYEYSVDGIRDILIDTADDLGELGFDYFYGNGLVDAAEAATGNETGNDLP
ncbi:MAG: S8 family peptidase [Sedimentisphaerales bacterium]|nr:S8 family peptidase [Sedimentisphaerales bacterium]